MHSSGILIITEGADRIRRRGGEGRDDEVRGREVGEEGEEEEGAGGGRGEKNWVKRERGKKRKRSIYGFYN